jgi:hypothetical protein
LKKIHAFHSSGYQIKCKLFFRGAITQTKEEESTTKSRRSRATRGRLKFLRENRSFPFTFLTANQRFGEPLVRFDLVVKNSSFRQTKERFQGTLRNIEANVRVCSWLNGQLLRGPIMGLTGGAFF